MASFGYTGSLKTTIDNLVAGAKARGNHTGTQSADTLTDGTTNKAFLATERTKLAGIAPAATANRTDAATDALLAAKADLVGGSIPTSQIPALALNTVVPVASRSAMLALTTSQVQPGDVAVDTSTGGTRGSYMLLGSDPTLIGSWVVLNAPTDAVQTVNGQAGTVVLAATDVGAAPASLSATVAGHTTTLGQISLATSPVTISSSTTMTGGAFNLISAAAGVLTATLPTPAAVGQVLVAERTDTTTNLISFGGTVRGVPAVATMPGLGVAGEAFLFVAESLTSWRIAATHKPKALLDLQYAAIASVPGSRTLNVISALSNPDSSSTLKQSEFLFRLSDLCLVKPNRWRLRIANYNVFGGAAVATGATFASVYVGPQAFDAAGAPTAAFSVAPTAALAGFTLPSDGSEYVSAWVSAAGALPNPKVPWLYSFAYTGGDTTTGQASGTGEAWTANTAGISANVGDQVARGNKGNITPFDIRIEYEYTVPSTTVYEMGFGDSLMGGAGPTFPKYKTWPQQAAVRRGRLISNVAVGSTTLANWSDNTRRLWTRFSAASAPDRLIIGLGTNDLNTTSLASMQAYFITILGLARAAYPGIDVVAMPIPPRNLPRTRLAQYAPAGSTSLITYDSVATGAFNLGEELFGETVTVSAVSGTGPYTLTVGATTKNHEPGEYLLGTKELQRTQYNTWLRTLPGGIQGVLSHDQALAAPWDRAIGDPQYVHSDNVHWSVAGLARAADLAG